MNWLKRSAIASLLTVSLGAAVATFAQPMGPGMMGGYGMGPGMMHGYGMGPGMMSACPGCGMGRGMSGYIPDLDSQQQTKITQIQEETRRKQWDLADKAREEQFKLQQLYYSDKRDPAAIGAQYKRVEDLSRQMVELSVETQNRVDSVLRPEQRQQMRRYWRGDMMWGW